MLILNFHLICNFPIYISCFFYSDQVLFYVLQTLTSVILCYEAPIFLSLFSSHLHALAGKASAIIFRLKINSLKSSCNRSDILQDLTPITDSDIVWYLKKENAETSYSWHLHCAEYFAYKCCFYLKAWTSLIQCGNKAHFPSLSPHITHSEYKRQEIESSIRKRN